MPGVYQSADLVLIPTLYSEGTSLSCLEALASRRAVIATNVGGLPDLILNGFNGLLIEPDAQALLRAVCTLLDDPALRSKLAANGYAAAQAFDVRIWQQRWKEMILETMRPARSED